MVGKKAAWSSLTSGTSCTLRTEAQPQSRTIATSQFKRFMVSSEVSTPWTLPECYHSASVRHGENTKGVGTHKHYASSYPPKPLAFCRKQQRMPRAMRYLKTRKYRNLRRKALGECVTI